MRRKIGLFFYGVLKSSYFPFILGLLAVLLTFLSIQKGFTADDYFHRNTLSYKGIGNLTYVLHYNYVVLRSDNHGELLERGTLPWWSSKNLKIAFFRPVSALTNWLDYQLWERSPPLMHLQSVFWYMLLCILIAFFYRKFIPSVFVAGFAAFLFTVDVNHLTPIVWLADRDRLIAVVFGLITLILHDAWRTKKAAVYLIFSALFFCATLLSAESGATILSYLIAYAVFLDKGKLKEKLLSLSPYILIVAIWLTVYKHSGFGVTGSGLYIDPTKDPLSFLIQTAIRSPILFAEQWFNASMSLPPAMWGFFGPSLYNILSPPFRILLVVVSFMTSLGVLYLLLPLLKSGRMARFWISGMILSIVFSSGTSILNGRLLNFAGIGAFAILAQLISETFRNNSRLKPVFFSSFIIVLLIIIHGVISPLQLFSYTQGANPWQKDIEKLTDIGNDSALINKNVVIVNAPSSAYFAHMRPIRRYFGKPIPEKTLLLSQGYYDISLTRTDAQTVLVQNTKTENALKSTFIDKNYFYKDIDRSLYEPLRRTSRHPFSLGGTQIDVLKYFDDGFPQTASVTFSTPLEDSSLVWYLWDWKKEKYQTVYPPHVGETIHIASPVEE